MAFPSQIATGTVLYLILGVVLLALVFMARLTGRLSKDKAEIGNVVLVIATVSMWLFWFVPGCSNGIR